MAKENIILKKTYEFALFIIVIYRDLTENRKEYVLSKQLLRSATSVGANSEEASAGITKKDFINKYQIAYKEAKESHYWLRLLRDSHLLDEHTATEALFKCDEIIRILNAILQSTKLSIS
ncbi:MAG: four helix bundle protein [Candidatus Symbiothrix sp.]|jgi:four helix bundle protein|nr:four helix bundle protein [Candidatus Symbiothrix sp.]